MPRKDFTRVLLVSISIATLAACSNSSGGSSQAKTSAPMPPITEMDAAMNAPAPQPLPLSESDTLTPIMPSATASAGSTEERLARLEQSVSVMQGDYQKLMPAFASLNTTNARIQTLLNEIEKDTGRKVAVAEAPPAVPVTTTTVTTTTKRAPEPILKPLTTAKTDVPATGVIPAPGTVSSAKSVNAPVAAKTEFAPVKTVTDTTTTVTTDAIDSVEEASAPPLSAFKEQPTVEEARAEAARQTGKAAAEETSAAAEAPAAGGVTTVKGVRIGEHGNKTRLVFDLATSAKPAFKYDLDNAEKLLLVEMPSSGWTGSVSGSPNSPLVAKWNVEKAGAGSTVAIQLKKDARVISTEFLKAQGKDPARLVVDIAPQG